MHAFLINFKSLEENKGEKEGEGEGEGLPMGSQNIP